MSGIDDAFEKMKERSEAGDYDIDPVFAAAHDVRLVEASEFTLYGLTSRMVASEADYEEVLCQVREEYLLDPEEIQQAVHYCDMRTKEDMGHE